MNLEKLQFLIDENVPVGILKIFKKFNLDCVSIQNLGWSGYKDTEIAQKIANTSRILITRDKDFHFLWERYKLRVVHLMIEPAVLKYITPAVKDLLKHWQYDPSYPFLLIVQNDMIRVRTLTK